MSGVKFRFIVQFHSHPAEDSSARPCLTMPSTVERKKIALCGIILGVCMKKQKQARRQRRVWCKEWLRRRGELESHATIFRELHDKPEDGFSHYIRMDVNSFHTLLAKVESYITKQDTNLRQSMCAEARLEATRRFLSCGCSYTALQYSTRMSQQSLSLIIPETCQAIYTALRDDFEGE